MTIRKETGRKLIQLSVKPQFWDEIKEHCEALDMPITTWTRELMKRELDHPTFSRPA